MAVSAVDLFDEEYVAYLAKCAASPNLTIAAQARAELLKVGPKGYVHGWIYVGPPKVGARIHHPDLGHGTVTRRSSKTTAARFDNGEVLSWEHADETPDPGEHLIPRPPKGQKDWLGRTPAEARAQAESYDRAQAIREVERQIAEHDRWARDLDHNATLYEGRARTLASRPTQRAARMRAYEQAEAARAQAEQRRQAAAGLREQLATMPQPAPPPAPKPARAARKATPKPATPAAPAAPKGPKLTIPQQRVLDDFTAQSQSPAAVANGGWIRADEFGARKTLEQLHRKGLLDTKGYRPPSYRLAGTPEPARAPVPPRAPAAPLNPYTEIPHSVRDPKLLPWQFRGNDRKALAYRAESYDRLTREQFDSLPTERQAQIRADVAGIADSRDTKTIRDSMGSTVRGVTADHVTVAQRLRSRFADAATPRPEPAQAPAPPAPAKAAVPTPTPAPAAAPAVTLPFRARGKAKRGDLLVVEEQTSIFTQGQGTQRSTKFTLARVTSVSKDGDVKAYQPAGWAAPYKVTAGNRAKFHPIPADRLDVDAALRTAEANPWTHDPAKTGMPYQSMADVETALRPHLQAKDTAGLDLRGEKLRDVVGNRLQAALAATTDPTLRVQIEREIARRIDAASGRGPRMPALPGTTRRSQVPRQTDYKKPTDLEPGAPVTWYHTDVNGNTTTRTGRVWDAAPNPGSAWVIPDFPFPGDLYSAIVVEPKARGGALFSSDDPTSGPGSQTRAAAHVADRVRRTGKAVTVKLLNKHITRSGLLTKYAAAHLTKVGPKGYIHGWIYVGPPKVGSEVHHPEHGKGHVARVGAKTMRVRFDSGEDVAFEHAKETRRKDEHFRPRPAAGKKTAPAKAKKPTYRVDPDAVQSSPDERRMVALAEIHTRLAAATDTELLDAFRDISAHSPGPAVDAALRALDAELARREGVAHLTPDPDPKMRRVDELVAKGWAYTDAYADVHGADPIKLRREERAALIDTNRRPGERRDATLRRMYADHVAMSYLQAEEATCGNVLNVAGRAKMVDPASLWSGTVARARKYASDELKQWWETQGGRMTFTQYRALFAPDADRATTQAAALAGSGRDFGL